MTRSSHHQPGFVLLLTLVLLAMAGVVLAQVGRRSYQQAMTSLRAEEDLQRQWALRTCEAVLLPQADTILKQAETNAGRSLPATDMQFTLGHLNLHLKFADEQAKLHVPTLVQRRGLPTAESQLRQLFAQVHVLDQAVLRPLDERLRTLNQIKDGLPTFTSYEQVVTDFDPIRRHSQTANHVMAPGVITLWGDGRVNVRRVNKHVLEQKLAPEVGPGQIQRLIQLQTSDPELTVKAALDTMELTRQKRPGIEARLTDASQCYSLWIITHDKQRVSHTVLVDEKSEDDHSVVHRLMW